MQNDHTKTMTWKRLLEECGTFVAQEGIAPTSADAFSEDVRHVSDYAVRALEDARAKQSLKDLAQESISAADYMPATYCRLLQSGLQVYPLDAAEAYRHALSLLDGHLADAAAMAAIRQGGAVALSD